MALIESVLGARGLHLRPSAVGAMFLGAIVIAASAGVEARPCHFITRVRGVVDYWPRFSPDGETVLFIRCLISRGCGDASTSGHWDLWTVPKNGGKAARMPRRSRCDLHRDGKAVQVTDCRLDANHAVWSPDGSRFAFSGAFGNNKAACKKGCRGIAIAPVPARILRLGTAD